jgi:ABC-type phosphate transport system substrate-binding protein
MIDHQEASQVRKRDSSDQLSLPIVAFAIGAAYSVRLNPYAYPEFRSCGGNSFADRVGVQLPEVLNRGSLLLNLATLADIYLGTVDTWDHAAIRDLNPELASLLPNKNITVVLSTSMPSVTSILIQTLSSASQAFRDSMVRTHGERVHRVGELTPCCTWRQVDASFPVERTGRVLWADDVAAALDENAYTLGVWPQLPIVERRYIGFADLINARGERVSASAESVASAVKDYRDQPFTSVLINGSAPLWLALGLMALNSRDR